MIKQTERTSDAFIDDNLIFELLDNSKKLAQNKESIAKIIKSVSNSTCRQCFYIGTLHPALIDDIV